MAAEAVPQSVNSDGNLRIAVVPSGANAKSVAILTGATTKALTYSLTGDGWNRGTSEETIPDERAGLKQSFSAPGTNSDTLEVTYNYGSDSDVAQPLLIEGTRLQFVDRRSVPNETDWTVGQNVDILIGTCGVQRRNAPTRNGKQTITQTIFIDGPTQRNVTLVA